MSTYEEWAIRLLTGVVLIEGGAESAARDELTWYTSRIPPVPVELVKRTVTHSEWEKVDE